MGAVTQLAMSALERPEPERERYLASLREHMFQKEFERSGDESFANASADRWDLWVREMVRVIQNGGTPQGGSA